MDFDAKKATQATVEWIRDWFDKNGPDCNAIIGVSGGKDSSIAAALLVEALGKEFDPNVHNAIQQLDGTDYASNYVCAVYQKGYMIGDKLIRPAMVAVAV